MATSKILQAQTALNAQRGTFYFTPTAVGGKYYNKQIELFDLIEFHLNMDVTDTTREVLNGTSTQHIDEQVNFAWDATCYNVRSYLVEMAFEKKKKGIPIVGNVVVTNNMKNKGMGVQTVSLTDFEIKSITDLLQLNVNDHDAKIQLSGYVEDGDVVSTFNDPDVEWTED